MIDVNVSISGIIMCCDENLCEVNFGGGYIIEKCEFSTLPFKDNITNGRGQLTTDYFGSRIIEDEKVFFMCLKKDEVIQIEGPKLLESKFQMSDEEFFCDNELTQHMQRELDYINQRINLLRLFKSGNIGYRDINFRYTFTLMGFMTNTVNRNSHNQTRNVISTTKFILDPSDVAQCNKWLSDYSGKPYLLLKDCIDEFSWGLEQIDNPTGFEQYTTALEMALLPKNQQGKKQMLANRVGSMLGKTDAEIKKIHQKVIDFYRFRSESLHEGNGANITDSELIELENMTRDVLKCCLAYCKTEYDNDHSVDWAIIKNKIMNDLVVKVTWLKDTGVLA